MKMVRVSMTAAMLLGAALAGFGGCTADPPPPDAAGGSGSGSSSGVVTTCGDGKLDMGEACDDGNNVGADGCSACAVDECYTCTADAGALSTCTFAAAGDACQMTKVCNGSGACVECVDATQCTGMMAYCFKNTCATCSDGVKNGDETDIDCGGTNCGKCADGKVCEIPDDCNSTFCVDGVCCAEACDGACLVCNKLGSEGTCDLVPQYGEDPDYGTDESCLAADGEACNGGGLCAKAVGQTCTGPAQCASARCQDNDNDNTKTCVKNSGEPCAMSIECQSNMCDPATMTCM